MRFYLLIYIFLIPLSRAHAEEVLDQVIKKSGIRGDYLGLWIHGEDRSFSHNGQKQFIPASLSKIPTAGAALEILGLGHKYTTEILADGSISSEGVLDGDLYLKGGGDPGLVSENFWSMVNELKRVGLKKIKGHIYVDDFLFDDIRFSSSRQSRRVDRAYDAPIGAMSFNWNSVNIFVRPGFKKGSPARVFLDPENEYVTLVNKAKTGTKTDIQVDRHVAGDKEQIIVTGSIDFLENEKAIYKSVTRPDLWTAYNLKAFLGRDGIDCDCSVGRKRAPATVRTLVSHESKPLREIIADMAKFSNNYVAEMLTKSLSKTQPYSMSNGVEQIRSWMGKIDIKANDYTFVSPSGFSRENKFTPEDLGKILLYIKNNFKISSEFKTALPLNGIDGTLRLRLKDTPGNIRAKTGYLSGAVGLAGFFEKNGKEYTFAFIYNGPEQFDAKAKDLFDNLIRRW